MIVKKYIGVQYDVLSCKDVQKYHEISHILNYASQMCNMMLYHGKLCNIRKYDNFQFNSNILLNKVHKVIIQYPMGLHIRHKSLCKLVLPSITKDIKYINKNKLLIYMIISVHNIY